jgi:hypothetical protein
MLNRVARDRVNHHSHHDKPKLHAVLSGRGVTQVSSYESIANYRLLIVAQLCRLKLSPGREDNSVDISFTGP